MNSLPVNSLIKAMRQHGLVRFMEQIGRECAESHLKDLVVDSMGPNREMTVNGRTVINFGSDSFLGLDQHPRVKDAVRRGVDQWGTHNGASRAFASVRANEEAEDRLAEWLGTEETLIFPSVSLTNLGALPGLVGRRDLIVIDEHAHNSMQEGAKIAQAGGVRVVPFSHCDPDHLAKVLKEAAPYRIAVVAIDGVYSMSGELPPLADLNKVCLANNAVLYVDDAHATGVLGTKGRGTVLETLGNYENTLVVGSLSKAFSCFGGFIGCSKELKIPLKMKSNTFIFGGPVPPPYLEAICVVCDILASDEYDLLQGRLRSNLRQLCEGAIRQGFNVLGGQTPIISILVGEEEDTLRAGLFLFERGFYVQSVTFPAVPYHAGVLRVQVNANHQPQAIEGLLGALKELQASIRLPRAEPQLRRAA